MAQIVFRERYFFVEEHRQVRREGVSGNTRTATIEDIEFRDLQDLVGLVRTTTNPMIHKEHVEQTLLAAFYSRWED